MRIMSSVPWAWWPQCEWPGPGPPRVASVADSITSPTSHQAAKGRRGSGLRVFQKAVIGVACTPWATKQVASHTETAMWGQA